jgi:phosphatidylcholine synthase
MFEYPAESYAGSNPMLRKLIAWGVHFYTGLGLVVAAMCTALIVTGGEENFRLAMLLLFVAMVIDGSDGYFARLVRVKEVLPSFDGRRLDDIIDFSTYTMIPLLLIWRDGLLQGDLAWLLLLPLLASAYGFSQTNAKTDDGYFLGFPSYWNVVAFYLFYIQPQPWFSVTVIVFFSVLTFVPTKYLHPSIPGPLSRISIVLGIIWALMVLAIITGTVDEYLWTRLSLAYPVYYMAVSWFVTMKDRYRS